MKRLAFLFMLFNTQAHAYTHDIPAYEAFEKTAHVHQLDPKALYSMALAESGLWLDGAFLPHPYAISLGHDPSVGQHKHEGFYPSTRLEAQAMLTQLLNAGYRNIGVGMMQVNIKANPGIVEDYLTLLDPIVNLQAASKVLKWCRRYAQPKDVFACYSHGSADSEKGQEYAARVLTYAQDFGQPWEDNNALPKNGVYTFEQFLRIALMTPDKRSKQASTTKQSISIVTQVKDET